MTITSDKMYYGSYGNTTKNHLSKLILTYFVRRNAEIKSITPESIPLNTGLCSNAPWAALLASSNQNPVDGEFSSVRSSFNCLI